MKLTSFTRAPLSSVFLPILPRNNRNLNFSKLSRAAANSLIKPQIPLFLRPPNYKTALSDLQKWHLWAKNLASSVGSKFLELDNGPDSTLLHRELNWLIQDVLENPNSLTKSRIGPSSACFASDVQERVHDKVKGSSYLAPAHIPTELVEETRIGDDDFDDADRVVFSRVSLDGLYLLWKQRIEERRPFQYIVGCEHWRDLVLSVEEGVLIPRPETELIVDLVSDVIKKENEELRNGLWADLGTGSGALAIAIGRILGSSGGSVVATDLSPIAVGVASYNVQRYHLQDKVTVKQGSWFEPLRDDEGKFAGLVSNPPYIPSEDINGLQAEVGKHEPRLALDGGEDGLNDLLHLCNGAASMLRSGGFFVFETNGEKHSKFLVDYMETKSRGYFRDVKIIIDFAGIQRFVVGYRA